MTGSELWTEGLICAFEFIRDRKKPTGLKSGSTIPSRQHTDGGDHEKPRVPYQGVRGSSDVIHDRNKSVSDDYRYSPVHDGERGGDHWVPIGWARILEIVKSVQADAGWDSQLSGIDDEDDFTVADLAAPYWECPVGPSWWCHVSAGHPAVEDWLRNAQWLHPAVSLALRDESRLISDRMKHLLYEVAVVPVFQNLFGAHGRSSSRVYEIFRNNVGVSSGRASVSGFRTFCTGQDLATKKCVPCTSKGMRPMTEESASNLLQKVNGWNLVTESGLLKLKKSWRVKSFTKGLEMFKLVADVAEAEGHHPDLHLVSWNNVTIEIWTHAVGGLTENDFILAAKINELDMQNLMRRKTTD